MIFHFSAPWYAYYGFWNSFINNRQILPFAGVLHIPCQTSFLIKANEKYSCKENQNLPVLVHLETLECSMMWKVTYICELRNSNYTKSALHNIIHNQETIPFVENSIQLQCSNIFPAFRYIQNIIKWRWKIWGSILERVRAQEVGPLWWVVLK